MSLTCCSNNTNKLSPQELYVMLVEHHYGSNNTNKLSPQERNLGRLFRLLSSNNTNKLSPQELCAHELYTLYVQIIQINLVLKNTRQIN